MLARLVRVQWVRVADGGEVDGKEGVEPTGIEALRRGKLVEGGWRVERGLD